MCIFHYPDCNNQEPGCMLKQNSMIYWRRLSSLMAVLALSFTSLYAQIPDGYYESAQGLTGEELKQALHMIIKDHVEFPYSSDNTDVWDILKEADRDPDNSDNVILIYTGWSVNAAQEYNSGSGWNREHVWAKSHGDFGTTPPAGTDAHHLKACDVSVNSARGNKDFDNGGSQHSEAIECYADADSWEPRDAVKGDVARMMFYMSTRYEGENGNPDLELVNYTGTSGSYFGKISTLLEWNAQDPVDDFERNRNNVVFSFQENRNPFIDHPEFADYIWGDPQTTNISQYEILYNVSPVPAEYLIKIAVNETEFENTEIYLYDYCGKIVLRETMQDQIQEINISGLQSGMYILKFENAKTGSVETKKIIKQ